MAVDYHHYVIVSGPRTAVAEFSHRIALVVNRRVAGVRHQNIVPFSFESMYAMARIKGDVPHDPYDMKRWPIVPRGRLAEVRYMFHTRNLEVHPLLKRLSACVPRVSFVLVTWCLDDDDLAPFTIRNGRLRGTWLGGDWGQQFWERAAVKFKVLLDAAAYENDMLRATAESWRIDAAIQIATGTSRRYQWTGGRIYRDLADERDNFMVDLARAITKVEGT